MRLLVNFVYCHPLGHAIEALHYAHGYHVANPDARISVALNAATPVELASLCPFVEEVYPVPVDVFDGDATFDLSGLPRDFDHYVNDVRGFLPDQRAIFPGLGAYYDAAKAHFTGEFGIAGHNGPAYAAAQHLRLAVTPIPRAGHPRVALLPGGSADRSLYPSVRSWELIIAALTGRFPDAEFVLVGKLAADGRTATTYTAAELAAIRAAMPRSRSVVDAPLVEQLATVAACDVLVSPHSGFGMAALAVGTPWLTIAGNRWPEYYFTGVPFYSVLPDITRFPCYTTMGPDPDPVDDDGPRSPSMSYERVTGDLPEIVDGAAKLIERRWPYRDALVDHVSRMSIVGGVRWSIDDAHVLP
ncbi:ADP-heptose:LPS heptosyltransferase [Actinokineospora terrae]|uniref:ADP-heptose:LPS heptosyltransferase n=1 Tax=Actinokineospora terrae TaxID=155974 RepID=A0A1H9XIC9_9PSEU|nr:ADP-heptose:LPS heptosyltransferase [Actinokineospora terrae]